MAGGNKRKAASARRSSKETTHEQVKKPKPEPEISAQIEEEEDKKPQVVLPIRRAPTIARPTPSQVEPDTRLINLTVKHQNGEETYESSVRIKRCTPLNKLMTTFYEQGNKEYGSLVFLYDGRGLRSHQTPQELDMDDGDEIDAMMHQSGGSTDLCLS